MQAIPRDWGVLDHAPETRGDRETRVDTGDINGEVLKEGHMRFKKAMHYNSTCAPLSRSCCFLLPCAHDVLPTAPQVAFIDANTHELPLDIFPDNIYDLYTIAFGIRNVTLILDVLHGAHRVLKLGRTLPAVQRSRKSLTSTRVVGFPSSLLLPLLFFLAFTDLWV